MSTYHLHARLFVGTLRDPMRNELQTREADSYAEAVSFAEELAERRFRVWLYEHCHRPGVDVPQSDPYRVIGEWGEDGTRLR